MLKTIDITLRPLSSKDSDFILALRNDLEISDHFFSDPPVYDFSHNKWLSHFNTANIDLIIEFKGENVGRIYLSKVDYRHQKGEFGIVLVKEWRGKDIARAASRLFIDYIFNNLPIRKISIQVFTDNKEALKLYKDLGFIEEGCLKEEYYKTGKWRDVLQMAVFGDRWNT